MACLAIGHPSTCGSHPVPDTDNLFTSAPRLRAQLVQLQTTLSQHVNNLAFLLKPLGSALRQSNLHKQLLESLTTSSIDRAILLSQSAPHTGAHLMQPNGEAWKAEDPTSIVMACPDKSAAGKLCGKPCNITIAMASRFFSKIADTDMNGPAMRESEVLVLGELPC